MSRKILPPCGAVDPASRLQNCAVKQCYHFHGRANTKSIINSIKTRQSGIVHALTDVAEWPGRWSGMSSQLFPFHLHFDISNSTCPARVNSRGWIGCRLRDVCHRTLNGRLRLAPTINLPFVLHTMSADPTRLFPKLTSFLALVWI